MRLRLIGALVLLAAASAQPSRADPTGDTEPAGDQVALGFDHLSHDGHVAVSGLDPLTCAQCHTLDKSGELSGRPDHAACFGACHGAPPARRVRRRRPRPYPIDDEQRFICRSCHSANALDQVEAGSKQRLTVFYPPYGLARDHGIAVSHAAHQAPTADRGDCLACHPIPGAPASGRKKGAHARCTPCHLRPADASTPGMDACATCHPAAFGYAARPHLTPGRYPVTSEFSHLAHLDRGGRPGPDGATTTLSCAACHAAAAAATDSEIPAPASTDCEGCHDGQYAFSTVGPDCRRCHQRPAERVMRSGIKLQPKPYSHRQHLQAGLTTSCDGCHPLSPAGLPMPASADHRPCSDSGCHREDFSDPAPVTCRACHVGSEPWRPLHTERRLPAETEFGSRFSHRSHLGGPTPLMVAACASCHGAPSRGRDMGLPHGHQTCGGPTCHRTSGGAEPTLERCEDCHAMGLIERKLRICVREPWSVRARFRHEPHRIDPTTHAPLACTECHPAVTEAATIEQIATPGKAMCARCHDGEIAFALTGHDCARCHAKSSSPAQP